MPTLTLRPHSSLASDDCRAAAPVLPQVRAGTRVRAVGANDRQHRHDWYKLGVGMSEREGLNSSAGPNWTAGRRPRGCALLRSWRGYGSPRVAQAHGS